MSNAALNWAWSAVIPSGPKFVLVALAEHATDHAGEDWTCFPSNERLCDFTGYPLRTLERHLGWLFDAGWFTREAPRSGRGRMQVRRYTLHREEAMREALRAERAGEELGQDQGSPPANMAGGEAGSPPANMAGGEAGSPPAKNPAYHPPKKGSPPANLAGGHNIAEPSEPLGTLTERAGEGASASGEVKPGGASVAGAVDWAAMGWAAMPDASRGWSSERMFRSAWQVEVAGGGDPQAMAAACLAYSRDRGSWGVSGKPVSAHKFVGEGRWKSFADSSAMAGLGKGATTKAVWAGPAEVREALVGERGEGWVASYLDPAGWDDERRVIQARTSTALARLGEGARTLVQLGVTVERALAEAGR